MDLVAAFSLEKELGPIESVCSPRYISSRSGAVFAHLFGNRDLGKKGASVHPMARAENAAEISGEGHYGARDQLSRTHEVEGNL